MAITMDGIFVNGQKATFHPEDILSGDASAYTEEIGTAVEEWMEENVTGGEQVTDTTLTLPGVPADSKKAGDEISALKEEISAVTENPNLFEASTAKDGYRLNASDGSDYADSTCFVSAYIPVTVGHTYTKNSPILNAYHRFCTYNSSKGFVRANSDSNDVVIASGEAYIRFCGLLTEKDSATLCGSDHISAIDKTARALIDDVNDSIDDLAPRTEDVYDWSAIGNASFPYGWRSGYYDNGAAKTSSVARMRTLNLSNFSGYDKIVVTPPSGKAVVVSVFNSSAGGTSHFVETIGDYSDVNVTRTIEVNPAYWYGFHTTQFDDCTPYLTEEYISTIICKRLKARKIASDDTMSDTSENSVQNKVIKAYVDESVVTAMDQSPSILIEWRQGAFTITNGADIRNDGGTQTSRKSSQTFTFPYPVSFEADNGGYLIRASYADSDYKITSTGDFGQGVFYCVPANTPFRLALRNQSDTSIADITDDEINEHVHITALISKTLYPVKWLAMGDSITKAYYSYFTNEEHTAGSSGQDESTVYTAKVAKLNGWFVKNIARGSTGWIDEADSTPSAAWVKAQNTDFAPYNLVTLAYGINDWKANRDMGTLNDDTSVETPTTVLQAMKMTIETIMQKNPACKIIVILPLNCCGYSYAYGSKSTNYGIGYAFSKTGTLEQFVQKMKEVCDYYGIQYIDQTHYSCVNRENLRTALPDGVHPSRAFHTLLAHELSKKITF